MSELAGAAATIEQCEAGEGRGCSRRTALRFRPESRLERFQLLAEGALAPLQRAALLALATEFGVRPRQPLFDGGATVGLRTQAPLEAADEFADRPPVRPPLP